MDSDDDGRAQRNVEYPERSPLELIDEEKRPFATRRTLSTCCGGFRVKYDEANEKTISVGLIILQLAIYAAIPATVLVTLILVPATEAQTALNYGIKVVAGITIVNTILQTISYSISRWQIHKGRSSKDDADMDQILDEISEETDPFYSFLIPSRSGLLEYMLLCFVITPAFTFVIAYQAHILDGREDESMLFWLNMAQIVLTSYGLISHAIPESTPYSTDDSFNFYSHHYQRHVWIIALGGVFVLLSERNED